MTQTTHIDQSCDDPCSQAGRELHLPCSIPGRLVLVRGKAADYRALAQYHYLPKAPATWAGIWTVRYWPDGRWGEPPGMSWPVAVGVLSYPTLACRQRDQALNLAQLATAAKTRFVNRNLRTISRVTVHPTFRSLGLGPLLVRHILDNCDTRYVEALAAMGRAHPLFASAGMTPMHQGEDDRPVYYLMDRHV